MPPDLLKIVFGLKSKAASSSIDPIRDFRLDRRLMKSLLACLLFLLPGLTAAAEEPDPGDDAAALYQRGEKRFFEGRLKEAVADWDREIALQPARGPHHWQRGLALYSAIHGAPSKGGR